MDETYVNERIKQICAEKGWSNYRLAKECGIPSSTVHNILHKVSAPSFVSLLKICNGLGITMAQFFAEDGDAVDLTGEQREVLDLYNDLSVHEREIAVAYMRGLAARKG
ncbi:MAG TPA: helix-turn-helix transcriptional regulator [Candidatus Scatomonas pullistercoris]|uniref:Helix-turn-helix transcriptional regulator n=1 Tax=Candidatus Scatomonas pullistercoris TaxID=2840920 RepID=A0A9D1TAI9_9FIRM|nr:helix-turn-helix transcriptional regulator [Candidatus Scatomonas pullistercoris]